jgi:TonB family protein
MIRLLFSEMGFTLALIVSAAIHAALLPMLLSFAYGSAPGHAQPIRESCINAFLVPGHLATAGKKVVLPGSKRREAERAVPVAAALPREVPEHVTPAGEKDKILLADIRLPAKWLGSRHDAGGLPTPGSPASPVLFPVAGDLSGSNGAGSAAARRESGEFSGGDGAGVPPSRREGTGENRQEWGGARPPKDADAVPRYGDNARPAYPPLARLRGYQGLVVLFVEVLADGRVSQVGIRRSAGHEILDRAALEAVRSWRFEPGRKEGRTVAMSVEVPVRFVLNQDSILVKTDDRR